MPFSQTWLGNTLPSSRHRVAHPIGYPALGPSVISQPILLMPHPHRWEDGQGQGKEAAKQVAVEGQG